MQSCSDSSGAAGGAAGASSIGGRVVASKAVRLLALLAALLVFPAVASAREPHWPASLTIGTASPGGTYHAYGEGLARLLTRTLKLPVTARSTEGPAQNIQLLEAGEI